MSTSVHVLGVDPGFASIGVAVVRLLPDAGESVEYLGLIETEKASAKRKVLSADDNVRRSREIAEALNKLLQQWKIAIVCAESMSFPRHSSSAAKMAMCWGVISALVQVGGIPIVQATPQEIKNALCGTKGASKADVEKALVARYGDVVPTQMEKSGVTKSTREHPVDALAAVVTCLDSEVLRMARRMM